MTDLKINRRTALAEQELVSSAIWFINIRWLAGGGVLVAVWFTSNILRLTLPQTPLYLIGVGVLGYNTLFRVMLSRLATPSAHPIVTFDALAHLQVGLDYVAMAGLIHFSGGLQSPAIFYFIFHIVISAILLSPRATYFYTGLATLIVSGIAALESAKVLSHQPVPEFMGVDLYQNSTYFLGTLFFFASAAFGVAYLAVTLSSRLRHRESQVIDLSLDLQQAYGRLQTLYESAKVVNSTVDLNQVLDRLARGTAETMNVRACSIRLLDETKTRLTMASAFGLSETYMKKGDLVLERNPLVACVLGGQVIAVADVATESRLQYPGAAIAEGLRSTLSAPLMGKPGPLGMIRAYSSQPNHFTDADRGFLSAIASYGSIAIENAMAFQAIAKLDQQKSQFVLTVTHELRSPVTVVRSLLRILSAGYCGILADEQRDIITRALRRADFLQTLIDDLLDLAAGRIELKASEERIPVRLDEAVERVVHRFELAAREKNIALEYWGGGNSLAVVCATTEGIDRLLNNLFSNAIKYTPGGGRVSAMLECIERQIRLKIVDTGIGIPAESLPHLFEEFYRAPNAKALEKEGTGLGLAIAQHLAARYGGQITAQSQMNRGSTFTLILPMKT